MNFTNKKNINIIFVTKYCTSTFLYFFEALRTIELPDNSLKHSLELPFTVSLNGKLIKNEFLKLLQIVVFFLY
jgi:hypothetical protein